MENSKVAEVKYIPSKYDFNTTNIKTDKEEIKSATLFLRFAIITGVLLQLVNSTFWVWTSSAIVKMKSKDPNINPLGREITTTEISVLFGTSGYVSLIAGCLLPKLQDLIGRKKTLHVFCVAGLFSAVGLAFCNRIHLIILFYTLYQIISVASWGVLPVYIIEICEDHNRVKYGCIMALCAPLGQLYGYVVGLIPDLRLCTLISAAPLIFPILGFFLIPESPVYLLVKEKRQESLTALMMFRSNKTHNEIEYDLYMIKQSLSKKKNDCKTENINLLTLFKRKETRIGLILAALPIFGQYCSGIIVIMPLLAPVFNNSGSKLSGTTIAIIVGVVKVSTFAITSMTVQKTGRKLLLILSSIGAGIMVSIVALSFYWKAQNSPIIIKLHWLPLAGIIIFIIVYSLGLGPIPNATMSELFSPEIRSTALSFISCITGLAGTGITTIYPFLAEYIGIYSCLWIFGCSCFVFAILFAIFLPEINGKSEIEIQEMLRNYRCFK